MKKIIQNTEQLQEAAHLLQKGTPTYARLTLMLLDNLAEVLIYNQIRLAFSFDDRYSFPGERKYPAQRRKKILSEFNKMIALAVQELRLVQPDDGNVFKLGHQFRNEAYHRGILRENIILAVAKVYLESLCHALPNLWTRTYSISSPQELLDFLRLNGLQGDRINNEVIEFICAKVTSSVSNVLTSLPAVLSSDLLQRIEEIDYGLEVLSQSGYMTCPADEVLKHVQFQGFFPETVPPPDDDTPENFVKYHCLRETMFSDYVPPVTVHTLEQWKHRAEVLQGTPKPGACLEKYCAIDRQMIKLEEKIDDAISFFDEQINNEIEEWQERELGNT